jgi:hypothetical protein
VRAQRKPTCATGSPARWLSLSLEDARRLVEGSLGHYNSFRLNSAIGRITPKACSSGVSKEFHAGRDRRLEEARETAAD